MIRHKQEDLVTAVAHLTSEMKTLNNLLDMASDEELRNLVSVTPVSYTHLTLPTKA